MNSTAAKIDGNEVLREVIGVFFDSSNLERAIVRLKAEGFGADQLGLLAHSEAVSKKLDHLYEEVSDGTDTEKTPEYRFVERRPAKTSAGAFLGGLGIIAGAAASGGIVASAALIGGPVGAATAGAVVVGGIGALANTVISESDAQRLQNYLEEGHLLLFVRSHNSSEQACAQKLISQFTGADVEVVEFRPDSV